MILPMPAAGLLAELRGLLNRIATAQEVTAREVASLRADLAELRADLSELAEECECRKGDRK